MEKKSNKKLDKLFPLKYGVRCPRTGRIFVNDEELKKLEQDKKAYGKPNNN